MPITRKCMDPRCDAQVSGNHLMCLTHWKEIPTDVQAEVCERLFGWKAMDQARQYLFNFISGANSAGKGLAS